MTDPLETQQIEKRMEGALSVFREELSGLRTGRPSPALLDRVSVDVYGATMPLNQLATVSVPDSRTLSVQVWDTSTADVVERAIGAANLGLSPQREGAVIRVPVPPLSEDRRRELVRTAHTYAEQAKVAIRNVRRNGVDLVRRKEKAGEISEDEARAASELIQTRTDHFTKQVDVQLRSREAEILQI